MSCFHHTTRISVLAQNLVLSRYQVLCELTLEALRGQYSLHILLLIPLLFVNERGVVGRLSVTVLIDLQLDRIID